MHTSSADWRAAADILGRASDVETVEEIAPAVLEPLHALLGSEFTTFDLYDSQGRMFFFRHLPASDLSRLLEPFRTFFHEHPVSAHWKDYTECGMLMHLSEQMPVRQFLRSGLFNEVYVHQRVKYQLGIGGRVDTFSTWSLATGRLCRDYTSREKELARFLHPRLAQFISRAARRASARHAAEAISLFLNSPQTAYALVGAGGRLCELSPAARQLLKQHLPGGLPDQECLPASCVNQLGLRRREAQQPAPPNFTVRQIGSLRALVLQPAGISPAVVIFQDTTSTANGLPSSLTRREAEILSWIGEGKANSEIATLLGISPRTVDKHCQNLFAKIGVESRLAAALLGRAQ